MKRALAIATVLGALSCAPPEQNVPVWAGRYEVHFWGQLSQAQIDSAFPGTWGCSKIDVTCDVAALRDLMDEVRSGAPHQKIEAFIDERETAEIYGCRMLLQYIADGDHVLVYAK